MKKRSVVGLRVLAGIGAAALAISACGSSGNKPASSNTTPSNSSSATPAGGSSSAPSGSPYVWGVNAELSGELASYGDAIEQGVQAYADRANAQGGINGRPIKVVALDNGGTESQAATVETQLATADKAIGILGNVLSTDCTASTTVATRYQVPTACLSMVSHSPYVYSLGSDNSTSVGADISAAAAVSHIAHPSVALLCLNTTTDVQLRQQFPQAVAAAGDKLATIQEVSLTSTDVSVPVSKLVASKPDVVVITDTGPGFVQIMKGLSASGLNVPLLYIDGNTNVASVVGLTNSNVYPMGATPIIEPTDTGTFIKGYLSALQMAGVKPTVSNINGSTLEAYLAAYAYGQALKTCGPSCTGPRLNTQLEQTHLALGSLDPSYAWTAGDHFPFPTWYVYHLAGSTFTSVASYPATSTSS